MAGIPGTGEGGAALNGERQGWEGVKEMKCHRSLPGAGRCLDFCLSILALVCLVWVKVPVCPLIFARDLAEPSPITSLPCYLSPELGLACRCRVAFWGSVSCTVSSTLQTLAPFFVLIGQGHSVGPFEGRGTQRHLCYNSLASPVGQNGHKTVGHWNQSSLPGRAKNRGLGKSRGRAEKEDLGPVWKTGVKALCCMFVLSCQGRDTMELCS